MPSMYYNMIDLILRFFIRRPQCVLIFLFMLEFSARRNRILGPSEVDHGGMKYIKLSFERSSEDSWLITSSGCGVNYRRKFEELTTNYNCVKMMVSLFYHFLSF